MNAQTAVRAETATEFPSLPNNAVPALVPSRSAPTIARPYPASMAKAILAVTREMGAIAKNGENTFHKYFYQKWDDILDRVSVLIAKHGLIITPSEVSRNLFENEQLMAITYQFTIVNDEGEEWPNHPEITAIARARDQKGTPDDKAAAKCHTQAEKYFLIHFFKIRTGDAPDSDADGAVVSNGRKPPNPNAPALDLSKPIALPTEGTTIGAWATLFMSAVKAAKSAADIDQWHALNSAALEMVAEKREALHGDIIANSIACRGEFPAIEDVKPTEQQKPKKPPAPVDEPEGQATVQQVAQVAPSDDGGIPENLRRRPPSRQDVMPNAATAMPEFLIWLDRKLAAFEELDAMQTFWNDKIAVIFDDLKSPDDDDVIGVWDKHERRLEP